MGHQSILLCFLLFCFGYGAIFLRRSHCGLERHAIQSLVPTCLFWLAVVFLTAWLLQKKKMELSCSYRSCLLGHLMKLKPSAINHIQVKMGSSGIFDPLGEVLLNNIHLNGAFRARCCYFGDQKRWRHKTSAAKQRLFDRNWFRLGKSGGAASSSSDWTKKSEGYETASRFGTAFIWLWPIRRAVS